MLIIKPIKNHPNYFITSDGEVWSTVRGKVRVLKTWLRSGYPSVTLCTLRIKSSVRVHRLLAEAFIPNPDHRTQVNHINGDKECNALRNLEWVTPAQNIQHGFRTGLYPTRENRHNTKLTTKTVADIRVALADGVLQSVLAKRYNIDPSVISRINTRKIW